MKTEVDARKKNKSLVQRFAYGKSLRKKTPRSAHAEWKAASDGRDPVELLQESNVGRLENLIPVRFGRMKQSPFAFFRGSAAIMAFDLSSTPSTGIQVQCCGDCHLSNFGGYVAPDGDYVFDINDFDETLPAPWEWDVKRLVASIALAARQLNFSSRSIEQAIKISVNTYRKKMSKYSRMRILEIWYSRIDEEEILHVFSEDETYVRKIKSDAIQAQRRMRDFAFPKLSQVIEGKRKILDEPPLIYHPQDAEASLDSAKEFFNRYRETLPEERKGLFDKFSLIDSAIKVAGVGSVGTRCYIGLFMAENDDTLFLQFKEARESVLEPYAGKSLFQNHGERIVIGRKLTQAGSDIFLGWTRSSSGTDFYVKQLQKIDSMINLETCSEEMFQRYCMLCGWALAKSHAKSGDAAVISGYLGNKESFDNAMVEFGNKYADQTENDFSIFTTAIKEGRLKAS